MSWLKKNYEGFIKYFEDCAVMFMCELPCVHYELVSVNLLIYFILENALKKLNILGTLNWSLFGPLFSPTAVNCDSFLYP